MFVGPHNTLKTSNNFGGVYSDPHEDDILAQTDPLAAGRYVCTVTIGVADLTDSRIVLAVRRLDANDDTVESIVLVVPFDTTHQYSAAFDVDADDTIAVVCADADYEASVWAAITWQRLK